MRPKHKFLLAIAVAELLLGCSQHEQNAGATVETTNGIQVSGQILVDGSHPATGALVTLRRLEIQSATSTIHAVHTTADGRFSMDSVTSGTWVLEARMGDSLAYLGLQSFDSTRAAMQPLTLSATRTLTGQITNPPSSTHWIQILGTELRVALAQDGSFVIPSVPAASLLMALVDSTTGATQELAIDSQQTMLPSTPWSASTSTPLDNFANGSSWTWLHSFLGVGRWYANSVNTASLLPSGIDQDASLGITARTDGLGKAMHINILSDGLLGLELGEGNSGTTPGKVWFDLRSATHLNFQAKGSGSIRVALVSKFIMNNYTGASQFESTINLDSNFTNYRLALSTFAAPQGSAAALANVPVDSILKGVSEITWFTTGSAELWLDSVSLEGIKPSELLAKVQN